MATFNKDKLVLVHQGIGGGSTSWAYTDTGLLIADINEVAGFFTNGYDCGMRHGDYITITEGDTGTHVAVPVKGAKQTGGRRQYGGTVWSAEDTGASQVTVGLTVLTGDTS